MSISITVNPSRRELRLASSLVCLEDARVPPFELGVVLRRCGPGAAVGSRRSSGLAWTSVYQLEALREGCDRRTRQRVPWENTDAASLFPQQLRVVLCVFFASKHNGLTAATVRQ